MKVTEGILAKINNKEININDEKIGIKTNANSQTIELKTDLPEHDVKKGCC